MDKKMDISRSFPHLAPQTTRGATRVPPGCHQGATRRQAPEPELTESLWIRLVPRLDVLRLCGDGQVAASVFGHLAQQIFQELVDWKWLEKVSLESHQAGAEADGNIAKSGEQKMFWVTGGEVLLPAVYHFNKYSSHASSFTNSSPLTKLHPIHPLTRSLTCDSCFESGLERLKTL